MANLAPQSITTRCLKHDMSCRIETNKYGCSDYVCDQKLEDRCDFRAPVKRVKARSCPKHHLNTIVYERLYQMRDSASSKRRYYRCNFVRADSDSWWCGYENVVDKTDKKVTDSKSSMVEASVIVKAREPIVSSLDIEVMKRELDTKKKLMASVKLSALPDGGSKLKSQIDELELWLSRLKLSAVNQPKLSDLTNSPVKESIVAGPSKNIATWPTTKSVFYDGVETTNTRRELLSSAIERIHRFLSGKKAQVVVLQ